MCRQCAVGAHVEGTHRVLLHVRAEVGVAHCHLDGGMPHQLLDGLQRYPAHDEVAGEGVAQRVPPDGPDARPLCVAEDGLRAGVLGIADEAAVRLREHPRGVEPPWGLAQGSQCPVIERYLSLAATPLGVPSCPR
jgi:hypothetical protein